MCHFGIESSFNCYVCIVLCVYCYVEYIHAHVLSYYIKIVSKLSVSVTIFHYWEHMSCFRQIYFFQLKTILSFEKYY